MSELAVNASLGRERLYKALSSLGKPRFDIIYCIFKALGVDFRAAIAGQKNQNLFSYLSFPSLCKPPWLSTLIQTCRQPESVEALNSAVMRLSQVQRYVRDETLERWLQATE
jgi:hypothetical protein